MSLGYRSKSYNHPSQQVGWSDSSPRVGFNEGQLKDEEYDQVLAIHDPLWRHIIQRYPKESECPIAVIGYNSIPVAIELSQWTYPITFLTTTWEGVKKARKDGEIHAGVFDNMEYIDFLYTLPRCRVVTFISILTHLSTSDMFSFLDMALRRAQEVVASEKYVKDWCGMLRDRYNVNIKHYEDGKWNLLTIKQKTRP